MPATAATELAPAEVGTIETDRQVCLIRFSPDGRTLVGGGYDSVIRRWALQDETLNPLEPLTGHRGWVQSIRFSHDGQTMFSVDSWGQLRAWRGAEDAVNTLWQVESAHDGWIRDLAVSVDGRYLATAGRDQFVKVWSTVDGTLVKELPRHEHDLCRVAFHPNGESLVTADLMGTLRHWHLASGVCERELALEQMHYYERLQDVAGIYCLTFDESGDTLLCGGGQPTRTGNHQGIPTLHQINWASLQITRTQTFGVDKDGFLFDLALHPSGCIAAVTSGNPGAGQLLLFRPDADSAFFTHTKFANCHSVAIHPDGQLLVVSSTNRNSQGNGAVKDKDGRYLGNSSPLHLFRLVAAT